MRNLLMRMLSILLALSLVTPASAQIDPTARGLALRAQARTKIGLVIFGQSNEADNVDIRDLLTYPQAFESQRNAAVAVPIPGLNSLVQRSADGRWYGKGGPWPKFYDDMWDYGYDVVMMDASIGSQSFFLDAVGYPRNRGNNANYFRTRRKSVGTDDPGTSGTLSVQNGPCSK